MNEKKKLNIDWTTESNKSALKVLQILLLRTLYGSNRIVWLCPLLFVYGFMSLMAIDIISGLYHYKGPNSKWCLVPIGCLILFEVLNQFAYYCAKKARKKAAIIKAIVFWVLFTIFCISCILLGLRGTKEGVWVFSEKWSVILVYLCISWILPAYSFCPDIRFYVLHGKLQNNFLKKNKQL